MTFTQHLRPHGKKRSIEIKVPEAIETMAESLLLQGVKFEAEVLTTGEVSLTAETWNVDEVGALAHEIVPNGPEVTEAVERLVHTAMRETGLLN